MRPVFRSALVLAVLLAGAPARAEIYKYYDADGILVLSDTVPKDNTEQVEKLKPQPIMTIPAVAPAKGKPAAAGKPRDAVPGGYTIVIQSPVDGMSYPRGSEPVPVGLSVDPGLAPGHRLEVLLDGRLSADLLRLQPDTMASGSHVLAVRVVDAAGKVLASGRATFHIQSRGEMPAAAGRTPVLP